MQSGSFATLTLKPSFFTYHHTETHSDNHYFSTYGGLTLRKYETIFVIDSLLKNEEIESIVNKYERFISANGGSIDVVDRWGKKRLAYEIKKRQYGYYVLIRFDGPPTMVKPLEREYRLNEAILRYKTLLLTPAALKALENVQKEEKEKEKESPKASPEEKPKKEDSQESTEEKDESETEEKTEA
ncbi:MAG: 30S ribosomal protein S6 [candidate division KSB1 bacterium]|nr:30S ribosomal protein S6 [candidate division KSB1 bacterium]